MRPDPIVPETRAEIARQRLARLAASFESEQSAMSLDDSEVDFPRFRLDRRHVRVLATLAVAGGVILTWWLLSARPHTASTVDPMPFEAAASNPPADHSAATPSEVVVEVAGKVKRPGIVVLPSGSRVYEAVRKAGGVVGKVDTSAVNMARVLEDGEQVLIGIDPPAGGGDQAAEPGGRGGTVNLNSATIEQLDTLPGIGPVTAQAIISWRETHGRFNRIEDLLEVKGIGEATFASLRELVSV